MHAPLFEYTLRLGDDALVLGRNLSAWCGHAPSLEVDLGLSSLALDLVGQASFWFDLAAKHDPLGRDADALTFQRAPNEFHNCLLVEQENGDFAQTLARQFLFSNYHLLSLEALSGSANKDIADIAAKSVRDVTYHVEFATDWMVRLGDNACLSHQRLVKSLEHMSHFVDELFVMDEVDDALIDTGIAIDKRRLHAEYNERVNAVLHQAGLSTPPAKRPVIVGRKSHEPHHVGLMLNEMRLAPHDGHDGNW